MHHEFQRSTTNSRETVQQDMTYADVCAKAEPKMCSHDPPTNVDAIIDKMCILHGWKKIALPKQKVEECDVNTSFEPLRPNPRLDRIRPGPETL